ncbi:MAG: 5'-methylthioadenosine/adenosylhomocysteine nucleosidase [Sphaerochaeta sp.]|nr:5'-methylthioadenosine/adenosylhomocysteine nucleosidase [Sphaerochaeta sp.]
MRKTVKNGCMVVIIVAIATVMIGCATLGEQHTQPIDPPIGVISAMRSELTLLVESAEIDHTDVHGGIEYHVGTLGGKPVVLVQAGVGKILAAAGAATLINEYGVDAIIFTGIAGGVADETKVLDVVVSTDLVVHDYGRITNDGFVWGPNSGTVEGRIPATEHLVDAAYDAAVSVVGGTNAFKGTIATGDQFVASEWYVEELQDRFNAYATEMEGAAVALVAYQYDVPFVVIRCMSDKADGLAHATMDAFGQRAADNSASIVIGMLESL